MGTLSVNSILLKIIPGSKELKRKAVLMKLVFRKNKNQETGFAAG